MRNTGTTGKKSWLDQGDYVTGKGVCSDLTKRIETEVMAARKDRKIRMSYLSYNLAIQRSEDRGISQGEIIKLVDLIWKKLKKDKTIPVIADETETDEEQVERIVTIIRSHGEDYDKKKIGSEYMEKYLSNGGECEKMSLV